MGCGELLTNLRGEDFAQLNTPLIEGVDAPDESLHCHAMLIQCKELTAAIGVELWEEQRH